MKQKTQSIKAIRKPATLARPLKEENPMAIVRRLGKTFPYILIHPESNGYSYKTIWQHPETKVSEIIGSSHKTFRTKQACISTIKKLKDFWGGMSELKYAYDHHGNEIDTKIKVEVKRFF